MEQPEGHMISIINWLSVNRSLKVVVVGGGGGGGVCGGLAHIGGLCIPSSLSLETSFFFLFICTGSSLYRD